MAPPHRIAFNTRKTTQTPRRNSGFISANLLNTLFLIHSLQADTFDTTDEDLDRISGKPGL